jgi:hypothetical protein
MGSNSDMYNRVLSGPIDNLLVGFTNRVTRTNLISDEYNRAFYKRVRRFVANPLMRELVITPKGWNKVDSESRYFKTNSIQSLFAFVDHACLMDCVSLTDE